MSGQLRRRMSMQSVDRVKIKNKKSIHNTLSETYLQYTKSRKIEHRDFHAEVRCLKDVTHFIERSVVLLDIHECDLDTIVEILLNKMLKAAPSSQDKSSNKASEQQQNGDGSVAMSSTSNPPPSTLLVENVTIEEIKSILFSDSSHTILSESIQSRSAQSHREDESGFSWDQTWLCAAANIPTLKNRHSALVRLKHSCNLGRNAEEIRLFFLVLCPEDIKHTKTAQETASTFATLLSNADLRHDLLEAHDVSEVKELFGNVSKMFAEYQSKPRMHTKMKLKAILEEGESDSPNSRKSECENGESDDVDADLKESEAFGGVTNIFTIISYKFFGRGIQQDLFRRIPYYLDDYKDGMNSKRAISKTISTSLFLYFSVILPAVALGVLNADNTHGAISVQQVIVGQTIGALAFTVFSGQPLVVVMTTAPLALFIKIIYLVANDFGVDFFAFYAMIGLWNSFFLMIYAFFNMSILMKYSSRSTEEIFSNFITIAFITDSMKNIVKSFNNNYWSDECYHDGMVTNSNETTVFDDRNITSTAAAVIGRECHPEVSFFSLILMLGTAWFGVFLFDFNKTPFLTKTKREFLSDYALPVSVIVFSLAGTVLFSHIEVKTFHYELSTQVFYLVDFTKLTWPAFLGSAVLGFSLSLLFFMDQNISAAMVDNPENKLQKGNAYHWDLLVIAVINGFLCIFGLPFLHAVLPHSPLHVKCLADTEERVENGFVRDIVVRVRETRMSNLISNAMIGVSILFLGSVLVYIPTAVLDGLFLYLAVTALYGNQMFERISLFIIEQSAYPPSHYIRRVPQRKIHQFTLCQLAQLLILCIFGFTPWPYIKMVFPLVILSFLPIRHFAIPRLIDEKYLKELDGH